MKFYRCRICGEVYMGTARPSNCPHCGAKSKYLVDAAEWTDENVGVELTGLSRSNLEKALQLEVNNAPFYRDAASKAKTGELQAIFKALGKIEAEHASAIRKLIGGEFPHPSVDAEKATDDDVENLRLAHSREKFAATFYALSAAHAVEPRVKVVFHALSEIESDHINLEEDVMDRVNE